MLSKRSLTSFAIVSRQRTLLRHGISSSRPPILRKMTRRQLKAPRVRRCKAAFIHFEE